MQQLEPLQFGKTYHIYNRGINKCNLFEENENYEYFLRLYDRYINPIAYTFAWVLMKNHFHLLVKIKDQRAIKNELALKSINDPVKSPFQYFSNLFNAYSKAFNKRYERTGGLFQNRFKRKLVSDMDYLRKVVVYIHKNPVNHGFVSNPVDYSWSSYLSCVAIDKSIIDCRSVVGYFDNLGNFKNIHNQKQDFNEIERTLRL
jgi:REP element-mobilizing transposase RayT